MIAEEVIQIIDGTLDDIEDFDEIALEHWEYFKNKKPMFDRGIIDNFRVVIAKDEEKTVGYAFYLFYKSPYYDETCCQIDMFFLKPEYRGQGIGMKMFKLVEQLAKNNNCKSLVASYNLKESLDMFYKKLGFNATHVAVAKEI